jgi:hypothetical protein
MENGRLKRGRESMASKGKTGSVSVILLSVFALWWTLFVFAWVSGVQEAWALVKWSPLVLIPWALVDIARLR